MYRLKVYDMAHDIWIIEKKRWLFWFPYSEAGCGSKKKMEEVLKTVNKNFGL